MTSGWHYPWMRQAGLGGQTSVKGNSQGSEDTLNQDSEKSFEWVASNNMLVMLKSYPEFRAQILRK